MYIGNNILITPTKTGNTLLLLLCVFYTVALNAQISADKLGACAPATIQFTGVTGASSVKWYFGDGDSSALANPTHLFSSWGTFTVRYKAIVSGISFKDTLVIKSYRTPSAIITYTPSSLSSCKLPFQVNFSGTSSISYASPNTTLTYEWDFGNGSSSNQASAIVAYLNEQSYSSTLKVTDKNNCYASTAVPVQVVVAKALFTVPDTVCKTVIFFNQSSTGSYSWNYGDGSTGLDANHVYALPGSYTVKLLVKKGTCSDSLSKTIVVENIKADFSSFPHYSCAIPFTINFTDQSVNAVAWQWHFGDGKFSSNQNTTNTITEKSLNPYTVISYRTYTDRLIVTSPHGCKDTLTKNANDSVFLPVANYMSSAYKGCAPLSITLSDSSLSREPIISREWKLGDGTISLGNSKTVSHVFPQQGIYKPMLIVKNSAGCIDTSYVNPILVGNRPHPSFSINPASICAGQSMSLVNHTPANDSADTWHLVADNQFFSSCPSDPQPSGTFIHTTGPQTLTLTAGFRGCFADTIVSNAIVVKGPIARLTAMGNCSSPLTYSFSANLLDADSWTWYFGDGDSLKSNVITSVSHSYTNSGNYKVILKAINSSSPCLPYYDTLFVYVRNVKADFVSPNRFCKGAAINFDGATSTDEYTNCIRGYTWFFDSDQAFRTPNQITSYAFSTAGIKNITLHVEDVNGCRDSITKQVKVSEVNAHLTPKNILACKQATVSFKDLSVSDTAMKSWHWKFGDGDTSKLQHPQHAYSSYNPSTYTVTFIAKNALNCEGRDTGILRLSIPDTSFSATSSSKVCIGQGVSFSASSNKHLQYRWLFGDGDSVTTKTPTHTYKKAGTFAVTLKVTDSIGCKSQKTISAMVQVQAKPTVGFYSSMDAQPYHCYPATVTFTDTSKATIFGSRNWWLNGISNGTTNSINASFPDPGKYPVKLVVKTSFGCTDSLIKSFEVHGPKPDFSIDKNIICHGQKVTLQLKDTQNIWTYRWLFGDSTQSGAISPIVHHYTFKPKAAKTTIILKAWSKDSSCVKTKSIDVGNLSVIADFIRNTADTLASDTVHCLFVRDTLINTSVNTYTYHWWFGDGKSSTTKHTGHTYITPGTYSIRLSAQDTSLGCADTMYKMIVVLPLPQLKAQAFDTCSGSPIRLLASGATTYTWSPAAVMNDPFIANPLASVNQASSFTLSATDNNGCSNTTQIEGILIVPPPHQELDTSIFIGQSVQLNTLQGYKYIYKWLPSIAVNCPTCPTIIAQPIVPTTYTLQVKDSIGCFDSTFFFRVNVDLRASIDVPTAFTPNGDGSNDTIYVKGWGIKELLEFNIYNRWGELIFSSNDLKVGWDGTYNGIPQPVDTYVYTAVIHSLVDSEPLRKKGYIRLIR